MAKEYILHKKQVQALSLILSPGVYRAGYLGGKRSGKTIVGAHFALKMIEERPHELGAIFSPTSQQLTHFTLAEFKNVLASYGIFQGVHYVVNINPKPLFGYESRFPMDHYGVWSFWNGAQIYTFSIESFFMGAEFGWTWGDEIQNILGEKLDEVTLRMSGSPSPKTFYTFTPPIDNPAVENMVYKESEEEPGGGTLQLVVGTTYDNIKNLEPSYIQEIECLPPLTYERDVLCRRVLKIGFPWLYCFDRKKHVSEDAIYQPNEMVYVSFDFNNNPFVCILSHRGVKNGKRYIHYFDCIELTEDQVQNGTFTQAMADTIHLMTPRQAQFNLYQVTGDATGRSQYITNRVGENIWTQILMYMRISTAQLHVNKSNPDNADARELCNAILASSHKPDKIDVLINPKLKGLIYDCERVQSEKTGKMIKSSRQKAEQRADWLDALKYDLNTFNGDFFQYL